MERQGCLFLFLIFLINPQVLATANIPSLEEYGASYQPHNSIYHSFHTQLNAKVDGLVYFRARTEGKEVFLDWEINGDFETSGFVLERKTPDTEFWALGGIVERGDRTYSRTYSFQDELIDGRDEYRQYRLKQLFKDGTFVYHKPITLLAQPAAVFQAYPNPAQDLLNVELPEANNTPYQISIFNSTGSLLMNREMPGNGIGRQVHAFDISEFSPGLLIVRVQSGLDSWERRIIKK